jgi:hypothetical protein
MIMCTWRLGSRIRCCATRIASSELSHTSACSKHKAACAIYEPTNWGDEGMPMLVRC